MKEMSKDTMEGLLLGNCESLNLEFKASFNLDESSWLSEKVIRAVLAMANTRSGGDIVIGVKEKQDKSYDFSSGLEDGHLSPNLDELKSKIESFSSSPVDYGVEIGEYIGNKFIVIRVKEFSLHPVICRKTGTHVDKVLEEGAIYVRTLKDKPSSVRLVNPVDIQDLFERAVDKQISNVYKRGWKHDSESLESDKSFYLKERANF